MCHLLDGLLALVPDNGKTPDRIERLFLFAAVWAFGGAAASVDTHYLDVVPAAGTLVLFDSVTMPHLVQEVTASRPRVAATGWFHEDSQLVAA